MKPLVDIRRLKLYAWIALAFLFFSLLSDLAQHPGEVGKRFLNDLWRVGLVTVLHYIFFEYSLPRLSWKKFMRSLGLVIAHLFLYSEGMYLWRQLGIALNIYTAIPVGSHDVSPQMEYSMSSLFFFG